MARGVGRRISGIFVPVQLDTSNVQRDLEGLNRNLGTVIDSVQKKFEGALNTKTLSDNIVRVNRALGELRDSGNALGQINGINIFKDKLGALPSALRSISEAFGGTVQQQKELYTQLVKTQAIDQQVKALQTLQRATRLSTEETLKLVRARGMAISTEAAAQFSKPTTPATGGRGLAGIFTPSSVSAGAQSALAATGVVTGMYGAVELTKSAYQASLRMENLQLAFQSVFGEASKASAQLDFVREVSDKLGLSFLATAEGAKKMFAAAKGTEVEKDANQIFQAFSSMSAALKLTGDETNSVFLAISQMISKGKISAEELRLQLSERMPGAVTLFAKSIGVTTKELDSMLQQGQVGLDALRKFALEVEKTYAAGAAGASKGLQAELSRVGNAWFDLKRAFVDARGSAETLSFVTAALKSLTEMAPGIMSLAGAFLKFAAATAASYAIVKSFIAIKTALLAVESASALVSGGLTRLGTALATFAKTPLGVAVALGATVAAVWSLFSAQKSGMEAISEYSYSLDKIGDASERASDKLQKLNKSVKDRALALQEEKVKTAYGLFAGAVKPEKVTVTLGADFDEQQISTYQDSSFSRSLAKLKKFGAGWNEYVSTAQELGKSFAKEFDTALKEGADEEATSALLSKYAVDFALLREKIAQTAGPEVAKKFEELASNVLGVAKAAADAKQVFADMGDTSKKSTQYINDFNKEFEAIQKLATGTDLAAQLKYSEEATASAKSIIEISKAVQTAKQRLTELGAKTTENTEEWNKNQEIVARSEQAFVLLGQAAIKNKSDLSILQEALKTMGEAAGLSKEQIEGLQKQMAQGFQMAGMSGFQNLMDSLDTEKLLAKATPGQRKAFGILSQGAKDESGKLNLLRAVMSKNLEGIQGSLKNTSLTLEQFDALLKKTDETANALDTASAGKKAAGNWETVNSVIQNSTKTLESWRAKLTESKADEFGVSVVSEIEKIDKAIKSSKATSEQISQLQRLRSEIQQVGEARKKQVEDEQRLKIREELTRTGSRITRGYRKLMGVDNAEVYEAAKQQYILDAEFFQKALEKKQISQDEFNNYMKMSQEVLADSWLQSQTDLYSRLTVAAEEYYRKYGDFTKHIGGVVTTAMDDSAKAISAFARSGASDFESLANAFAAMADRMLATAMDLMAQQAISSIFSGIMGAFGGSLGKTVGIASGTISQGVAVVKSAKGNVFSGGNLSSYSNSIVSSPTLFTAGSKVPAYARGAGLMGEAGPEAIMPLVRTSSGNLGVRAEGSGASINQSINVNVINNASSQVTTQESRDDQGNISIDVMIEEHVAKSMNRPGSGPYNSLRNRWGGSPALAQRG